MHSSEGGTVLVGRRFEVAVARDRKHADIVYKNTGKKLVLLDRDDVVELEVLLEALVEMMK